MNNDTSKKNNFMNANMKIELTSAEKKNLINAIRDMLIDESNLTLEINSEDYSIKQNNNINLTFEDTTYPEKFSWVLLKETQEYLNGISTFETFKIYQSIITNRLDYAKNILKEKINLDAKKNKIKQKKKKEKEEVYCSCRKFYQSDWIACDSEDKHCPGKGWYHIAHIDELKGYDRVSFENTFDKYYCPYCREKLGLKNVLKNNKNEENIEENKENKNKDENEIKKESTEEIEFVNINNSCTPKKSNDNNNDKMEIEEEQREIKEEKGKCNELNKEENNKNENNNNDDDYNKFFMGFDNNNNNEKIEEKNYNDYEEY